MRDGAERAWRREGGALKPENRECVEIRERVTEGKEVVAKGQHAVCKPVHYSSLLVV